MRAYLQLPFTRASGSVVGADLARDGSPPQTDCGAGSYADETAQSACKACPAGKMQSATAATACIGAYPDLDPSTSWRCAAVTTCPPDAALTQSKEGVGGRGSHGLLTQRTADRHPSPADCPPGAYCIAGSSTPLPCLNGTYSGATNAQSADTCTECEPGNACSTGSTAPTPCSHGSYAPQARMKRCVLCSAGSFQDEQGATACKPCSAGEFCTPFRGFDAVL